MTPIPNSLELDMVEVSTGARISVNFRWIEGKLQAVFLYDSVVLCHTHFMSKSSPTRRSRVFTISFPEDLARQVEAVAKEESRNISELFREAFRRYRIEKRNAKLDRIRAEVAKRSPSPYTEDDVESLVDEVRRGIYEESLRDKEKKTA